MNLKLKVYRLCNLSTKTMHYDYACHDNETVCKLLSDTKPNYTQGQYTTAEQLIFDGLSMYKTPNNAQKVTHFKWPKCIIMKNHKTSSTLAASLSKPHG